MEVIDSTTTEASEVVFLFNVIQAAISQIRDAEEVASRINNEIRRITISNNDELANAFQIVKTMATRTGQPLKVVWTRGILKVVVTNRITILRANLFNADFTYQQVNNIVAMVEANQDLWV